MDAGAGVTAGEQTAGNGEEAPFLGSGCSPAGKEAAALAGMGICTACQVRSKGNNYNNSC